MRTTIALIVAGVVVHGASQGAAPVVSGVSAQQHVQPSMLVDIYYTVQDSDGDMQAVMLHISTNSGASYDVVNATCWGDVGDMVTTGINKHIIWDAGADLPQFVSERVRAKVWAFDAIHKAVADADVQLRAAWRGANAGIVLEWDLQTLGIQNLRYSPFYGSEAEITAAQYSRFLNAWAGRFTNKTAPACTVTSVMNSAQGGVLMEVHAPGDWKLCAVRATPNTDDNNAYSKIMWDGAAYVLNSSGSETNEPMTEVSWYGAVAYCQWLNEREFGGNTELWKYRLPTEWEYEYVMGGRGYTQYGGTQDWGSTAYTYGQSYDMLSRTAWANNYVNYGTSSWYQGTVAVGSKGGPGANARNVFGMYDVSGNAGAWCLDWWSGSVVPSGQNFVNRNQGASVTRSVRGGHWTFYASLCDVRTYRWAGNPSALSSRIGFVVVGEV